MGIQVSVGSGVPKMVIRENGECLSISPSEFGKIKEVMSAVEKLLRFPYEEPRAAMGAVFTINGEPYLFARKSATEWGFYSLYDGNRWTDAKLETSADIERALASEQVAFIGKLRTRIERDMLREK